MKSRLAVGMIGFGTVGTGVAKILLRNAELIAKRVGVPVDLVRVADLDIEALLLVRHHSSSSAGAGFHSTPVPNSHRCSGR